MNVIEISKYPPRLMRHGRYLREDWTSASQIGETWQGAVLTLAAYLAVEDLYVRAAERFMLAAEITELQVHGLEHWDEATDERMPLPQRPRPLEGERVPAARAGDLLRRFLREQAWAELVVPRRFLIHPGHDLRLLIATDAATDEARADVRQFGLYTYSGVYDLPTMTGWDRPPPAGR